VTVSSESRQEVADATTTATPAAAASCRGHGLRPSRRATPADRPGSRPSGGAARASQRTPVLPRRPAPPPTARLSGRASTLTALSTRSGARPPGG
jgi:hypothetical protein